MSVLIHQATNAQIAQAIITGNLGVLKKWVKSDNQFKRTCHDLTDGNNNALRLAIEWDQIEVVKWLVEKCKQPICAVAKTNQGVCDPHGLDQSFDAALIALRKNNYALAGWLIDHELDTRTQHMPLFFELFEREDPEREFERRGEKFEFFKFLYKHVAKAEEVDPDHPDQLCLRTFNRLVNFLPFPWIKWIVAESRVSPKLETYLFFEVMTRGRASFEECTEMVKWMIKDSGQCIDCRNWDCDCKDWEDEHSNSLYGAPIRNDEAMEYIDNVKKLQDYLGLEKWYEGIQGDKKIKDGKQRRRL